jgi:predicted ArsR family transcriptional regulator
MARNKGPDHSVVVLELLRDYGPQTTADLAEQMPITRSVVQRHIELLRAEGKVTLLRRSGRNYWILQEDAEQVISYD